MCVCVFVCVRARAWAPGLVGLQLPLAKATSLTPLCVRGHVFLRGVSVSPGAVRARASAALLGGEAVGVTGLRAHLCAHLAGADLWVSMDARA